jgi:Predicted metal-binding integral membrane protein (DUF2182)
MGPIWALVVCRMLWLLLLPLRALLALRRSHRDLALENLALRHQLHVAHDFRRGSRGAMLAGVSHGAYCLGCCWALMVVLVLVGLMNLAWMAALALIFLLEKNWSHGVFLTRVVGVALVVLGVAVALDPAVLHFISGAPVVSPSMGDHT